MARVPFNTTIDEELLLEMKKNALDYKINLNNLIEECWRCFSVNKECKVRIIYAKKLNKRP